MSFLNLRISGRLYAGFGMLLLFCAGLAGFAVWQLGEIRTQVAAMTLQSNNTIRVGEIATELQAIRRAILRYAFDHDEKSFAEAETRLKKSTELLEEAAKTTISEERRAAYRDIAKDVEELKVKRVALGEAVKQMMAGRALLFTDGDKMAADVQKFVDAADKDRFRARGAARSRPRCFWSASRTGGCWRPVMPRASRPSRPTSAKAQAADRRARERPTLPPNLAALLAPVKTGVAQICRGVRQDRAQPCCSETSSTTRPSLR